MMVTIVVCYAAQTAKLLRVCLDSIARHRAGARYRIKIYTDSAGAREANDVSAGKASVTVKDVPSSVVREDVFDAVRISASFRHAFLLDEAMKTERGLVLTLDSDCFPVADGWLGELVRWHKLGRLFPGVLWPWEPPADDGPEDRIGRRVREYHNNRNTCVFCQLVDSGFVRKHKLSYARGDDTGFALIDKFHELYPRRRMTGWMPTRCALPRYASAFDPEFNRHCCVIYGDMVCHIGGGSGTASGRVVDVDSLYTDAIGEIYKEHGAEWILKKGKNHAYHFRKEEEVAQFKMNVMYQMMRAFLATNKTLFSEPPAPEVGAGVPGPRKG